jgi:hypothetical protein
MTPRRGTRNKIYSVRQSNRINSNKTLILNQKTDKKYKIIINTYTTTIQISYSLKGRGS